MPNEHTIAENLQRLVDAKTAIGNAITAKGGTVGQNDGLEEFPADIASIQGGLEMNVKFITGNKTIPQNMFYNNHGSQSYSTPYGIEEVVIGNGITSIGGNAFHDCTGLTSVTISNSVTTIDWNAFYNCTGLTSVTIPRSVTSIGNNAFYGCGNLTTITIKKPQGSISGAPWGAPNATIVWTG